MTVWTISWQVGSGGERIAHLLAERAGVPLVDPRTVAAARGRFEKHGQVGRIAPWISDLSLSAAVLGAATDVIARSALPSVREVIDSVILEAARSPAVITGCSAFAVLADHPSACHVRIRAPLDWRIRLYARENCLSLEASKRALLRLERKSDAQVQRAYRGMLDSAEHFTLICDSSRFLLDDLVAVLLRAGRRSADQLV
jgi:cytidylate kinase